jgi:thioredoxin reductase (NADPH)
VTGRELAQLSYLQALKFGAEFVAPCHVTELKRDDGLHQVRTGEGDVAISKTVIIATGVSYRLLDVEGSNDLLASGVYYNATAVEARMRMNWPVHVVGGGNSAGQAAMFLTQYARKVTLLVRGNDLRKSMSSYLCDRVAANPEIEVRYHTQVTAIEGTEHIRAVHLRDDVGNVTREETTGVFIFIGARPRTDFLPAEVARDDKGFALTGSAVAKLERWKERRLPATGQKLLLQAKIFINGTGMCARPASEADLREVAPKRTPLNHCFQYVIQIGAVLKRDASYMIATQHIEW